MKHNIHSLTALLLSVLMVLSFAAGCGSKPADTTKPDDGDIDVPGIIIRPGDPTDAVPEPVPQAPVTAFPEAFELLIYLGGMTQEDADAFAEDMTGAQAAKALTALGASPAISSSAATVTGAQLLGEVMKLLGYQISGESEMLAKAAQLCLTRGFYKFDAAAPLSVEQGANILLSALQSYKVDESGLSTGEKLGASKGVEHVVLTEYDEPFNRPGSKWVSTSDGSDVTGEYTAVPLAVFGTTTSWCDILVALGFALDDPANEQYIPKYFRNCDDGSQLTERFWKAHNGENGHGTCQTDYTGGQDALMEIYEVADYEYRRVVMNTYLGVSDVYGLTVYGFDKAEFGPYTEETRPAYGFWVCHHYWNAYGLGSGYEVMEPATVIHGTLTEGTADTTTIDGVEYTNGQSFSYGKRLTVAPGNVGQQYYFLLDRYGFVIGCSETETPAE